jgi:homocysteine S-methyltransferase
MTKITLLDGSIGQELVKLSGDKPTPLWSTSVMMNDPSLVLKVHDSYFQAGSTVATTNTYTLLPDRMEKAGLGNDQLDALITTAISLARESRDLNGSGRIAGSIGPLEGSYRPQACPPVEQAAERYKQTVALLAPSVDVLLIETMSSVEQAEGALRACCGKGKPVWLGVTVDDHDGSRLRSLEPLEDLKPLVEQYQPDAVLIMCSRPEVITDALDTLRTFQKPFGAYANGFSCISKEFVMMDAPTVDALHARHDLTPQAYGDYCMKWIRQGATIIGGCCEVGPAHIAEVANRIRAAGYEIV